MADQNMAAFGSEEFNGLLNSAQLLEMMNAYGNVYSTDGDSFQPNTWEHMDGGQDSGYQTMASPLYCGDPGVVMDHSASATPGLLPSQDVTSPLAPHAELGADPMSLLSSLQPPHSSSASPQQLSSETDHLNFQHYLGDLGGPSPWQPSSTLDHHSPLRAKPDVPMTSSSNCDYSHVLQQHPLPGRSREDPTPLADTVNYPEFGQPSFRSRYSEDNLYAHSSYGQYSPFGDVGVFSGKRPQSDVITPEVNRPEKAQSVPMVTPAAGVSRPAEPVKLTYSQVTRQGTGVEHLSAHARPNSAHQRRPPARNPPRDAGRSHSERGKRRPEGGAKGARAAEGRAPGRPSISRKGSTSSLCSTTSATSQESATARLTDVVDKSAMKRDSDQSEGRKRSEKKHVNKDGGVKVSQVKVGAHGDGLGMKNGAAKPPQKPRRDEDNLFFDPRRIWATTPVKKRRAKSDLRPATEVKSKVNDDLTGSRDRNSGLDDIILSERTCDVTGVHDVLNNGKPSTNQMTKAPTANYINNDLRDGSHGGHKNRNRRHAGRGEQGGRQRASSSASQGHVRENSTSQWMTFTPWPLLEQMRVYGCVVAAWVRWGSAELAFICWNLVLVLYQLVLLLIVLVYQYVSLAVGKLYSSVKKTLVRLLKKYTRYGSSVKTPRPRHNYGLEDNISLPVSGEEAMRRLLACRGKDPYSILGLRYDATDDDIRRHYRRQAVLVHPDKNQQPGAEEAFKVLGHAFELIGDPVRRRQYDAQTFEAAEQEAAMKQFADLLTKLQEKMTENANMMRCSPCGGKHQRVPVDRPWYAARHCARCKQRHQAKEGDVWAETTVFGFYWHFYACMEGNIYDVTEWAKCHNDYFKRIQANTHHVMYRISTQAGSRRHRDHGNGEGELDAFLNRFYHQGAPVDPRDQPMGHGQAGGKKKKKKGRKH